MTTTSVIDSLVVELGLDSAKFTEGQKEALAAFKNTQQQAVDSGKVIEAQGVKVSEFFGGLKREALGLLGVFVGGREIKEFVQQITSVDAAVGRMSQVIGISAKELGGWKGAIEQIGGSGDDATAALNGLESAIQRISLTGEIPREYAAAMNAIGGVIDRKTGQYKSAPEIELELADYIKRSHMSAPRASAFLRFVPGMNDAMVQRLLTGREETEKAISESAKAQGLSDDNVRKAQEFQKQQALLKQRNEGAARSLMGLLYPALTAVAEKVKELIALNPTLAATLEALGASFGALAAGIYSGPLFRWLWGGGAAQAVGRGAAAAGGGLGGLALRFIPGIGMLLATTEPANADEAVRKPYEQFVPGLPSAAERQKFIRAEAKARGIDPDVAVEVARSEGLFGYFGDHGTSFGDFQLHYSRDGRSVGNLFTKQTGLDARDPKTWQEQDRFALDYAAKNGWGPWHGWRGLPYAGITKLPPPGSHLPGVMHSSMLQRGGDQKGNSHATTINAPITIHAPSGDARDIAREVNRTLDMQRFAAAVNYAQV